MVSNKNEQLSNFEARAQATRASTSLYFLLVLVVWLFAQFCKIL